MTGIIHDLRGLGLRHLSGAARAYMATIGSIFDTNYRDMVGQLYVVNAPRVFAAAWRVAEAVLSEHTREKVRLGSICAYCNLWLSRHGSCM